MTSSIPVMMIGIYFLFIIEANQTVRQYYEQIYAAICDMDIRTVRSFVQFYITQM